MSEKIKNLIASMNKASVYILMSVLLGYFGFIGIKLWTVSEDIATIKTEIKLNLNLKTDISNLSIKNENQDMTMHILRIDITKLQEQNVFVLDILRTKNIR